MNAPVRSFRTASRSMTLMMPSSLRRSSSGRSSPRKRFSSNSMVSLWTGPRARMSPVGSSVTAAPSRVVRCRTQSTVHGVPPHRPNGMSAPGPDTTNPRTRRGFGGGASRARTGDLRAASATLSQLSYGPSVVRIVAPAGLARRGGVQLDRRDVAPELLEAVEAARLGGEDVQDEVEVVRNDPGRLALTLDVLRDEAFL